MTFPRSKLARSTNRWSTTMCLSPCWQRMQRHSSCRMTSHNLSQPYGDSGKTTFKWPANKILEDLFSNLPGDQTVVLACLLNVISFRFGPVPSEEAVADQGDGFAGMDNGPELGADLAPIHAAILLLIAKGGHSFHSQGGSPPTVGWELTLQTLTPILVKPSSKGSGPSSRVASLLWTNNPKMVQRCSKLSPATRPCLPTSGVGSTQVKALLISSYHHQRHLPNNRVTSLGGYSDEEDPPRQHRNITQPKAFGLAVTRLLLCVVRVDALVLGEVNDLLQVGFISENEISAPL